MSGNQSKESLEKKYSELMEESFRLSHSNRKMSDMKRAEADDVAKILDELEKK
jgi:hypothetical protein